MDGLRAASSRTASTSYAVNGPARVPAGSRLRALTTFRSALQRNASQPIWPSRFVAAQADKKASSLDSSPGALFVQSREDIDVNEQYAIAGYTPANYIVYSDAPADACGHRLTVEVQAPVAACYELFHDWSRLVEFFDMIAQIGLNPQEPEMALFQCFYRWGLMPTMEIVFVLKRTITQPGRQIAFESTWGMPMTGSVTFKESGKDCTQLTLDMEYQLPKVLMELKVDQMGIQHQMETILQENLATFQALASGTLGARVVERDQPWLPVYDECEDEGLEEARQYEMYNELRSGASGEQGDMMYQGVDDDDDHDVDALLGGEESAAQADEDDDADDQGSAGQGEAQEAVFPVTPPKRSRRVRTGA